LIVAGEGAKKISVALPSEAYELCVRMLELMATGHAAVVVPIDEEITTQQAADLLNVSRPFFVTLLDDGKIPHRLVGSHRRVQMTDVLAYKSKDDARRKAILDELTVDAEKHGLGY
jgi:excisionase family DNA binding protein